MNQDIKLLAKEKGVKLWRVAEEMHINDSALSRMMRYKIPEEQKLRIIDIIERLSKEKIN